MFQTRSNSSGFQFAITFDDGCETDFLSTAPILKSLGFGATFYATAGFIGKPGYMSPGQLRELHGAGFEIGCHSMTHHYLPDLDDAALDCEISGAKTALEQMIGAAVLHFSCPGRPLRFAYDQNRESSRISYPRHQRSAGQHELSRRLFPWPRGNDARAHRSHIQSDLPRRWPLETATKRANSQQRDGDTRQPCL